jgi:hypothetical protein
MQHETGPREHVAPLAIGNLKELHKATTAILIFAEKSHKKIASQNERYERQR